MGLRIVDMSNWKADCNPAVLDCDGVVVQVTWGAGELNTTNGITGSVWRGADAKIQAAAKRGLKVGYMHYIRGVGAQAEARFFANNTTGYLHKYVPFVDWEKDDNSAWGNRAYLDAWLGEYIALTGVHPLVYSQRSEIPYIKDICRKHDCGIWEACYANMNPTGWQNASDIWSYVQYPMRQYTSAGRIGGYNGNLDLNLFAGDGAAWDKYAKASGSTPAPTPAPAQAPTPKVLSGSYTVAVDALNVRDGAGTGAHVVASYRRGQKVNLDGWGAFADGFLWGRYRAYSGAIRYVAIGKADRSQWYLTKD